VDPGRTGVALDFNRLPGPAAPSRPPTDLAEAARSAVEGTHVTVILPPAQLLGPSSAGLLHDRTADKIAAAVSRIPRSAATIVPYERCPAGSRLLQAASGQVDRRERAAKAAKAGREGPAARR